MSLAPAQVWALVVLACILPGASARAEVFRQLSGGQIRTRFIGNVLTDGTHWRETYVPGGKLLIEEMGSEALVGSWRVDSDRLCKKRPAVLDECYAVWAAGDRVELRHPKYPPLEGFLRQKPSPLATRHSSSAPEPDWLFVAAQASGQDLMEDFG